MKAKKRTAADVVKAQVCAMSYPFMSVKPENQEERRSLRSKGSIRLFDTVREKKMKGILDAAARSVASMEIGESDIYTDPKTVYTSKEVKQFQELVSGNAACMNDISEKNTDGGVWDVSSKRHMKKLSCYGH